MDEFDDNFITVYKLDHRGEPIRSYSGEVVERSSKHVCLRAVFGSADVVTPYLTFATGDVMTEWFFADRWYNVFRIADARTGALKGWYCNVARPARFSEEVVTQEDLALDVFVAPDGAFAVLDEDEFEALELTPGERSQAYLAVEELRDLAAGRFPPFDA